MTIASRPCGVCRGTGLVHDHLHDGDSRWDYPCNNCDGFGHIILGREPEREWVDCLMCDGSRINAINGDPCSPCDGRGRVLRTVDRTMDSSLCIHCGGCGCPDCNHSGLAIRCPGCYSLDDHAIDCPKKHKKKVTYTRQVVARTEVQLAIDVWIEKKQYQIEDQLVLETKIVGGENHPWPQDVLRIDVPCGAVIDKSSAGYVLKVPPTEIFKDRIVQVKEYINEGRDVMAWLVGFYSLLRWVTATRRPTPTTESEIRFSLLELD